MKTLRTMTFVAVMAIMVASVAHAAPTVSIRIGDGNWDNAQVHPSHTSKMYVYLSGIDGAVNAVEYKLNLPANVAVMSNTYPFAGALDFGGTNGHAIGFGECVPLFQVSAGADDLLVHEITFFTIGTFAPSPITLTAFEGGTDSPTTPRYSTCDGQALGLETSGAILESTTGVPTDGQSWGAIKSLY